MTASTHWLLLDEMSRARRESLLAERQADAVAAQLPHTSAGVLDGLAAAAIGLLTVVAAEQSAM